MAIDATWAALQVCTWVYLQNCIHCGDICNANDRLSIIRDLHRDNEALCPDVANSNLSIRSSSATTALIWTVIGKKMFSTGCRMWWSQRIPEKDFGKLKDCCSLSFDLSMPQYNVWLSWQLYCLGLNDGLYSDRPFNFSISVFPVLAGILIFSHISDDAMRCSMSSSPNLHLVGSKESQSLQRYV